MIIWTINAKLVVHKNILIIFIEIIKLNIYLYLYEVRGIKMNKKAVISISSNASLEKDDLIEVLTPGEYYKEKDTYYAVYDETEISGMEGTTTTLEIRPNKLSLVREGTTSAKMEFEKNNKYVTLYNTPYGVLELLIQTNELSMEVDDNGGQIFINYNMSISGQKPQRTELKINIKA